MEMWKHGDVIKEFWCKETHISWEQQSKAASKAQLSFASAAKLDHLGRTLQ